MGITGQGISAQVGEVLSGLGLPAELSSDVNKDAIRRAWQMDKKRRSTKVTLPLPVTIGQAREDIEIEEEQLWSLFLSCTAQT